MPERKFIKIGMIGYRNHAERIMSVINTCPFADISLFFHPTKDLSPQHFTNNLDDLLVCDVVMIASPTDTHIEYLKFFIDSFKGYIFCEKPLVNTHVDCDYLRSVTRNIKERMFVNFNYRYSRLCSFLDEIERSKELGELIHVNIWTTFGLAFKPNYLDNWRADGEKNLHAITETASVHYVDLFNYQFGTYKNLTYAPKNVAKTGTSYDTSTIFLEYENMTCTIFCSYAAPYFDEMLMIFTDGYITFRNDEVCIFNPRDTFDKNELFKTPPCLRKFSWDNEQVYEDSLDASIGQFLNYVKEESVIPESHYDLSIKSNEFILNIQ